MGSGIWVMNLNTIKSELFRDDPLILGGINGKQKKINFIIFLDWPVEYH